MGVRDYAPNERTNYMSTKATFPDQSGGVIPNANTLPDLTEAACGYQFILMTG